MRGASRRQTTLSLVTQMRRLKHLEGRLRAVENTSIDEWEQADPTGVSAR